ncbi:MAG: C4-dicarboxylate ABC transporter [Acidobacteria bacterium]|nr:C4-dicarboxylate ABC transporter [Acidobacteriota bacterium]
MNLAWLSVGALAVAVLISCVSELNVGVLSIAFAWIIGVYFAGLTVGNVASGFPVSLFLTLTGVTLIFTQASQNGTLDKLAHRAMAICRGNVGLLPIMFFFVTAGLASIGPGNIAGSALVAPMAMAVAGRAGVPMFTMAMMVGMGAGAGSLSPFAPTGIIVNGILAKIGLGGHTLATYLNNLGVHAFVAIAAYFILGGWKLFGKTYSVTDAERESAATFEQPHLITLGVIAAMIVSVIVLKVDVGMAAFLGASVLTALKLADHKEAIKRVPWSVIIMVCGVTVLIAILEKTEGLDLFTSLLAKLATEKTVTGVIAFVTGLISVYSSTSGVVLPAFLPTIPGLIERLGGGNPIAIASAMNVGGHLVDVSPLSTIGALCIAAIPPNHDARDLFNKLMAWGLSMTVVGGVVCYLLFGVLQIP